ncbi:hypothetical protein KTH06_02970 [Acinetobacter ursingii]|uniref:hypothetical protein n=1 Tax=Acinetobacter ursingii TaxID=108980 RepID=UPI001250A277|nr:hypothetical protein [Acinetobacter ursingii]MCU4304796.1 hypothetical protein [Acinetobacter ursingii]MCU4370801.1 hypothetical protein [Acinetobacter ursingii]MDG9991747.1 hypothetical protein [Acinetobacter ursingii]MDH0205360.1 hypothetical protein [Acinetobacter ursingii]
MIKPNWDIFSSKYSTDKESVFEWFAYLLFCREYNLPKGWFGFKNQSGIEKNPITHDGEVIGFQAKFYSTSLSDHKDDFLQMLEKTKRDYTSLTKILIYTNQLWGQAYNNKEEKMSSPKALLDIEKKAKELNIVIEWREASFFDSEFVAHEHDDLSRYFFTEEQSQGWQRFDDWSNTKASIEEAYFVDNDIKVIAPQNRNNSELNVVDGINAIRNKLSTASASVRLVGLSGVGKTRFAQALFDERIGENNLDVKDVWYCDIGDSPNPLPEHFIEELKLKNKSFILVVDNCGQDTHANLTKKIQSTKISLLTIEYDVKDDLPERTNVYKLQPNSTDIIQKVIERHYPNVNDINRRKIADFSGGNYRLALAIASNIGKTDNLALLTDSELFERLFWQKGRQNEELFKIAKNFALVYSFNIEDSGEENSELDFLSNLAKVDSDTAIEAIEILKSKDIVQQRGVWRAILPHALANHLVKELISTRLVNQLDKLTKSMPERLQRSFIKRLSYFHDLPKIKDLVTLWFSNEGFLGEKILTGNYDAQDLVKIRLLSQIDEDQLLNLFKRKHQLDPIFLTRENPSFVEISHLIRALAYQEHNFAKAFHLLVYFTKDEKEDERNNSIMDLLTSLFKLRISETLANLEQKKEVLTTLHANEENLPILLACLSKALNFHESGYLILGSNEGGRSSDYGYQPKTYDELWSWTEFLLEILNKLDQQGVAQARKIFVNNIKDIIWTCGKVDFVKAYLEKFSERSYFSEAHTRILNILKFNEEELNTNAPELLLDLENLERSLRPTKDNLTELIKSYILVSDHDLYKMTKKNDDKYAIRIPDFDNYEDLIHYISNELTKVEKLIENLDLLLKANTGWMQNNYLIKLGEASSKIFVDINQCINSLSDINIEKSMRSSEFLVGLLVGFKNNSLDDFYVFIEFLRQNDSFKHTICLLLIQACQNDDDFQYFSKLIIDKKIDVLNFPRLSANKYHDRITNDQFEILLDALISVGATDQIRYELLEECFFQKKLNRKYMGILLNEIKTILKNDNLHDHSEDALEYLFTLDDAYKVKVLQEVKSMFDDEKYISIHRNSRTFKLLNVCVEKCTDLFLILFLQDQKFLEKFWMKDLRKILVYAEQQSVLNWIGHDRNRLQFWMENSNLFIIQENGQIFWLDLLLHLLDLSDSAQNALDQIIEANIFTLRSASGSWSEEMKRRLPSITALKDKIKTSYPTLLPFIDLKEKEWLKRIEVQSSIDDQDTKLKNESFEW